MTHTHVTAPTPGSKATFICFFRHRRAARPRARPSGNDDSPKIIEETRQYIRDFDRVAGTTTTARELYDKMLELYPDRAGQIRG